MSYDTSTVVGDFSKDLFAVTEDPLSLCPEPIREMVADLVRECSAPESAVVAAAMALIAAVIGPKHKIAVGNRPPVTPGFHVLVAHTALRQLDWFALLQAHFIETVFNMQKAQRQCGGPGLEFQIAQHRKDAEAATKFSPAEAPLVNEQAGLAIASLTVKLKPFIVLNSSVPQAIAGALPQAFDASILCTTMGADPIDDLALLSPQERRHLAVWLNQLWEGQPCGDSPDMLSLLWNTPYTGLRHLTDWREFHAGALPVPLLLQFSLEPHSVDPKIKLPGEAKWNACIDRLFEHRIMAKETIYTVDSPALTEFEANIAKKLDTVPECFQKHVVWLIGLPPRLALVIHLIEGGGATIPSSAVDRAVGLVNWFGANHLRAMVSVLPVRASTDAAAGADSEGIMLAKITKKGPVTRRALWRSFNKPKAETFDNTLDALLAHGKVTWNDRKELIPVIARQ